MLHPIALGMPGGAEWIIIAAIGLLLFGKRLPEVGRGLGKGIMEFKKGLKGVEEEDVKQVDPTPAAPAQITAQTPQAPMLTAQGTQPAPATPQFKFDPYTGKPVENSSATPQT